MNGFYEDDEDPREIFAAFERGTRVISAPPQTWGNGQAGLTISIYHEGDCWWATASDAPGWTGAADTLEELNRFIAERHILDDPDDYDGLDGR